MIVFFYLVVRDTIFFEMENNSFELYWQYREEKRKFINQEWAEIKILMRKIDLYKEKQLSKVSKQQTVVPKPQDPSNASNSSQLKTLIAPASQNMRPRLLAIQKKNTTLSASRGLELIEFRMWVEHLARLDNVYVEPIIKEVVHLFKDEELFWHNQNRQELLSWEQMIRGLANYPLIIKQTMLTINANPNQ